MRVKLAVICFFLIANIFAQEANFTGAEKLSKEEIKTKTIDAINSTVITKDQMISMIDKLIASGKIPKSQGEATKGMVEKMSDEDLAALKSTMINMMSSKIDQMDLPKH